MKTLAWISLCMNLISVSVLAEDWSGFRGPTQQGLSQAKGLPTRWDQKSNIIWKQAIPGQGWSSPVVVGGSLFLTSAVPTDKAGHQLLALSFDAKTGAEQWRTEVFKEDPSAPKIHGKNSHASPTPLVESGRIYAHFGHQGTACLDLAGKVIWSTHELSYPPRHGNGGSPVLVDDLLIFSADAETDPFLAALDKNSGKLRWKVARESDSAKKFSFSTPLVITVNGKKQLVSPGSNVVGGYDPTNGKLLWWVRFNGYSVVPRPVYAHGLVFFSTGYDHAKLLAVDPTGQGDVTETHLKWTQARNAPNTPSPLVVDDLLYVVSDGGIVSCLEPATGKAVWQKRLGGDFSASPIYADGKIYLTNELGVTFVCAPGRECKILAENDLGERSLASPAAIEGALFLRTQEHLYCIGERG